MESAELTAGLQAINDRYYAAVAETQTPWEYTGGQGFNSFTRPLVESSYPIEQAEADAVALLNRLGYNSAEDLKQSVPGSHNDRYINLGIANGIYDDKSTGFEPHGGSSRDVNLHGAPAGEIGSFGLAEQGKDPSIFDSPLANVIAAIAAPITGGLSVAAQQALRAADGDTLHTSDYANAATSYLQNSDLVEGLLSGVPESGAAEQAAFDAYEAAQQVDGAVNFTDLGLSNLPQGSPAAGLFDPSVFGDLSQAAQAAYESQTSGVINNLVSGGSDAATSGYNPALWDTALQALGEFSSRNEQGEANVPPIQEQAGGGLLTPGSAPSQTIQAPLPSAPQNGSRGDGFSNESGEGGWEYLGGDRWQSILDGRIHREAVDPVQGTGSTRVGEVRQFPEYAFDGEGADTVSSGLTLGDFDWNAIFGSNQQTSTPQTPTPQTLAEGLAEYYASNPGQYQTDAAAVDAANQPSPQPSPQPDNGLSLGGHPQGFLSSLNRSNGTGTGTGDGSGGNTNNAGDPNVPPIIPVNWTPELAGIPLWDTLENGWESNINRPDYGDPVMQGLLTADASGGLQAPMVTPASNSNQPSFAQWKEDYENGLLQSIASKQSNGLI